ncbi:MAG TPA: hypothetical protein VH306_02000 [Gaiellaceae bacterium]
MADDWRVTVELVDESDSGSLARELAGMALPDDRRARLGDRVVVSEDDGVLFLYADTEDVAREANVLVHDRLRELGIEGRTTLTRWHPVEQVWEDPDVPLPATEAEWEVEHERLQAREASESLATGHAEWEVRVELPDHEATSHLADGLESEGLRITRRWTFVLVGAVNEDEARALADRIQGEAPAGTTVHVEPGGEMAWEVAPQNPFAVFGGLGG